MPVREVTEFEGNTGVEYSTRSRGTIQLANNPMYLSKDQRYRGMIYVTENDTIVNGHRLREAVDALTIDGVEFVEVPCHKNVPDWSWNSPFSYRRLHRPYKLWLTSNGKIAIKAPCGETRQLGVRTVDRILTHFGC